MDKVRVYLEKQLRKNSNGGRGISKLHRECMIQALMKKKAVEPLMEKACSTEKLGEDNSSLQKETDLTLPNLPYFISAAPTTTVEVFDSSQF